MEKLNNILKNIFKLSSNDIDKDFTMNDVDRWDSLTHMDLIVTIEDELQIQLDGDEIAEMITFDTIRSIVKNHLK